MNKLKKLFLTVLGAVLFVCMGVAIAACGGSKKYTVTTEYEAGQGTVALSPEAEGNKYEKGTEVTVTVTPKTGYEVDTFTVSTDENAQLTGGKYTFEVSADTTVKATFKTAEKYSVTKNDPENGTIEVTPAAGTDGKYDKNTAITVTLKPATGYEVDTFTVGGVDKKADLQDNVYTFTITANTTIAATFKSTTPPATEKYSVTKNDPANGTIEVTPAAGTDGKYDKNTAITVTLKPAQGYEVDTFTVGGVDKKADLHDNVYTFTITANTAINATFKSTTPAPVAKYSVTKNDPENGTIEVTPAAGTDGKYEKDTSITVTLTPAQGYEVDTFTANSVDKKSELQDNVYTFTITADTTITVTFKASFSDFLTGKKIYSFTGQVPGYTFENGKATSLATGAAPVDYVIIDEDTARIGDNVTLTKNANGTLTIDEDVYFVVGVEITLAVKQGETDVNVVFTIQNVETQDEGIGEGYVVTFGSTLKYGDHTCIEHEVYGDNLTLTYVEGTKKYEATVNLTNNTATVAQVGISLYDAEENYRLDVSTEASSYRYADFYKKDGEGYTLVAQSLSGKSNGEGGYDWETTQTVDDTMTTYTIVVKGATWGEDASKDNFDNASIEVTKVEKTVKTLTAKDGDTVYEVTFLVEGEDVSITAIRSGAEGSLSTLYNPAYSQNQQNQSFGRDGMTFTYSYTKDDYDASWNTLKHYYTLTFTLTGDSVANATTMTVGVKILNYKIFYGVGSYDNVLLIYDDEGVPAGIVSFQESVGTKTYTGTSKVEKKGDEDYVITFTTKDGDEIKFNVTGPAPNFNVTLNEDDVFYQVTVTQPAEEEGTLSISDPANEAGYVKGEKVTITVEAKPGYKLVAVKVNDRTIEPVGDVYSFEVDGDATVSAEFAALPKDSLDGKRIFGLMTNTLYSFGNGKMIGLSPALTPTEEEYDYTDGEEEATFTDGTYTYHLTKNEDGTLTLVELDNAIFYFVGTDQEYTLKITEGGSEVDFVFTIDDVTSNEDESALVVEFGYDCYYGEEYCRDFTNSFDNVTHEATITFYSDTEDYSTSHKVTITINAEGVTATKKLAAITLYTGDMQYALMINTENEWRPATFVIVKGPDGRPVYVNEDTPAYRQGGELEGSENYYWEVTAEDGTVYTITITGAKWGTTAGEDDYSEATITVTSSKKAGEDFLDGKMIFSFVGNAAFSFEGGNVTQLDSNGGTSYGKYVIDGNTVTVGGEDSYVFIKNEDNTLSLQYDADTTVIFYFVGDEYEYSLTLTEGKEEVTLTFTIQEVYPDSTESGIEYFDAYLLLSYDGGVDDIVMELSFDNGYELSILHNVGLGTAGTVVENYTVTVDLAANAATKELLSVTIYSDSLENEPEYGISIYAGPFYAALFYVKGEFDLDPVGDMVYRLGESEDEYRWEVEDTAEDGTTTVYTIKLENVVWGGFEADDDFTDAVLKVTSETKPGTVQDFLAGKTIYSFTEQLGYKFENGKATSLATGSSPVDYAITSETTATIGEDTLTLNDDGSLTIDGGGCYYFVGVEVTLSVKEGGQDVNVVFTIEKVEVQNTPGVGDEYTVTFSGTTKYGEKECVSIENGYATQLTLTYVEGSSKYTVTVDLSANTATKALAGVSLLTEDQLYRLDINTGSASRYAELYKKNGSSYNLVADHMMRTGRDNGTYYWEGTQTVGDTMTTYTIDIEGAIWGSPASLDKYSGATITVTTKEQTSKTLTAQGTDKANYEVTFLVEDGETSITRIKKDSDDLYNPRYMTHQNGEVLEKLDNNTFKYSYSSGTTYYVITFEIKGEEVSDWTMTVTVETLSAKTINCNISIDGGSYESVTILYGSDGKPTGIASIEMLVLGEGSKTLTGTSKVEDKGNGSYVITFTTENDGEIKLLVKGTGPNFTVELYEGDSGDTGETGDTSPKTYEAETELVVNEGLDNFTITKVEIDAINGKLYIWGTKDGSPMEREEYDITESLYPQDDYRGSDGESLSKIYTVTIGWAEYNIAIFNDGRLVFCDHYGNPIEDNVYNLSE